MKKNIELANQLIIGASIRIGKKYASDSNFKEGDIITLVEGYFDYDNGLYTETQTAPSIYDGDEYDSIYHLFGNDLEGFMDCKVVRNTGEVDKDGKEVFEGDYLRVDGSLNDFIVEYADGSSKYDKRIGFVLMAVNNRVMWNFDKFKGSRCKIIKDVTPLKPHEIHKKERLNKISGDCDEMYCDKCEEVTGHLRQPLTNQPDKLALTCCICNNQKN